MFIEGIIKSYNEERGFGFIKIENQKKELFFHIKDLPNKQYIPKIGERLKFQIVRDNNEKMKAENIIRMDIKLENRTTSIPRKNSTRPTITHRKKSFNLINILVGIGIFSIFLAILIPFISNKFHREVLTQQVAEPNQIASSSINNTKYTCDGRVHCSQMRSRDEAVFFINNCPGTKMDGDGDGIPCEGQFK
ncbi:cold shock domain-containing protein [Acinetobacter pollinis]|uniref:cold shock domain-containing protein n=1 Tax=Acinetobacter pollinis TaxID=2605270 RepID=UPI0018C201CA|nr:cold shock domain-containing protein [Acinetobacter pollinis]MBF7694262.1 cold shock domain-containing protein [Acinetobacter pollinis]MBF7700892.1 cold shock domain-containing protein [Acinetobacter pollinis]